MEKSINDVAMDASYTILACMYILVDKIKETTGLNEAEALAMATVMLEKKCKEIKQNIVIDDELPKYIIKCKREFFGEVK